MSDLKKYYLLPAPPEQVYIALTNPATIQLWTGEKAEMSIEPNSEFSLWSGSIAGRNLAFIPGKKIMQHWYFGDEPVESIVTILLHPHKNGTSVELRHTNIPEEDLAEITEGWDINYFGSLFEFFDE